MANVYEKINELVSLKKKWDEKRIELIRFILDYKNPNGI